MKECPSIGEWLNKLCYMLEMEYYCAERNNEPEEFYANWKNLQELMAEWKEQNQENIVYRDRYTVVKSYIRDFLTSSCNAETQNNAEGLLKKRAPTHIQRRNCENRNTEKTNK